MKILVTGGLGYIGSYLLDYLTDFEVTVVDNLMFDQNHKKFLKENIKFEIIDVNNIEKMKKFYISHDLIIPLAGIVGAPLCDKMPEVAINTNQYSIKSMCQVLSKNQLVVMPVSNSGYGIGEKDTFCNEQSPLKPISIYGKSKVEAEKYIMNRQNSVSLRLATVFGVNQKRMRNDLMVNNFTYKACIEKKIDLFEPNFRRNFIHISDVCKAFLYTIKNWEVMKSEIYNLGLDSANITKKDLCDILKKKINDFDYKIINNQKDPDQRDYFVSNEKIKKKGFTATLGLNEGIDELINYYKTIYS